MFKLPDGVPNTKRNIITFLFAAISSFYLDVTLDIIPLLEPTVSGPASGLLGVTLKMFVEELFNFDGRQLQRLGRGVINKLENKDGDFSQIIANLENKLELHKDNILSDEDLEEAIKVIIKENLLNDNY
ncbi:hypothetical protein [Psychroserpens luteolus]|uniref:hypothetical protein n=1 Tax=Psychroserpens luteolus TaxID=2855840 RepID=UPI001E422CD1|nr:hypothetical protein [Psychroserpens luteolus]MCD2260123.1 hypothetical protein [Psychroserpens luteolus]